MKVLVCPGCRGAPARGTGQRRGALEAGSPRASGMEYAARECKRGQGPPPAAQHRQNLSSGFTLPDSIHSPGRGTKPPGFPRVADKGFWHHRWLSVDSGGPACPHPPCPQAAAVFCRSAGEGGRRGLMGSPRCCVGQGWSGGYTHPSAHPAAPLPTQSCSPGSHRAGELREWGGRSGLLALGPLSPAAGDVPEPPSCSVEGLLGFDPCPAQPLKPRTFQIQSRVEENEIDRGFHFSLGSHLFNPLLLLLDSTEMGSNHQNPGTTGVAHRQGPGPGLSSHSTMEITRFRLR